MGKAGEQLRASAPPQNQLLSDCTKTTIADTNFNRTSTGVSTSDKSRDIRTIRGKVGHSAKIGAAGRHTVGVSLRLTNRGVIRNNRSREKCGVGDYSRAIQVHQTNRDGGTTSASYVINHSGDAFNQNVTGEDSRICLDGGCSEERRGSECELNLTSITVRQVITCRGGDGFGRTVLTVKSISIHPISSYHVISP